MLMETWTICGKGFQVSAAERYAGDVYGILFDTLQGRLITIPFSPTNNEQGLYEAVSRFLQRDDTYAFPQPATAFDGINRQKTVGV